MAKKKKIRDITKGRIYIQSTFNNTRLTFTDNAGNVLASSTAGTSGFTGTRKSTPYAAFKATRNLLDKIQDFNLKEVDIFVKGVGIGRDSALRTIASSGLDINTITDITPIPHNGCRPRKPRRV